MHLSQKLNPRFSYQLLLIIFLSLSSASSHSQLFTQVPLTDSLTPPSLPVDFGFGSQQPDVKDIDFGDLDGDGDLDIYVFASDSSLIGGSEFLDRIFLNGNLTGLPGSFSMIPVQNAIGNPTIPSSQFDGPLIVPTQQRTYDGDLVDVDNDGDLDVLRTDISGVYLLLNNGNATFEFRDDLMPTKPLIETGIDGPINLANFDGIQNGGDGIYFDGIDTIDLDGDGDLDAVAASYNSAENLYLINCWNSPAGGDSLCTNPEGFVIGNRNGDVFDILSNDRTHGVAFGNIDPGVAPDLPDLFWTNTDPGIPSRLIRNLGLDGDGSGRVIFQNVTSTQLPSDGSNDRDSVDAEFADLDDDGDLDLYIVNANQNNVLFWNNGSGSFSNLTSLPPLPAFNLSTYDLQIADFDDDGDLDVFEAWGAGSGTRDNNNRLLLNGGGSNAGMTFVTAAAPFSATPEHRLTISAGDFDNDSDIDLVGGNFSVGVAPDQQLALYENNTFSPADQNVDLALTIDATGSMTATDGLPNSRIDRAKNMAMTKVAEIDMANDRIAINEFATASDSSNLLGLTIPGLIEMVLPGTINSTINGIVADGVATSAGAALGVSLDSLPLTAGDPMFIPGRPRSLLVITDGFHNFSPDPQTEINTDFSGSWPNIGYYVISISDNNLVNSEFRNITTNGSKFYSSSVGLDLQEFSIDAEAEVTGQVVLDVRPASSRFEVLSQPGSLTSVPMTASAGQKTMHIEANNTLSGSHLSLEDFNAESAPWSMDFVAPQKVVGMRVRSDKPTKATLTIYNNKMKPLKKITKKVNKKPKFIGIRNEIANIKYAKLEFAKDGVELVDELYLESTESKKRNNDGLVLFAADPNDTNENHTFNVGSQVREFRLTYSWQDPENQPLINLVDPNGNTLNLSSPDISSNSGTVYEIINVRRPISGQWVIEESRPQGENTRISILASSGQLVSDVVIQPQVFEAAAARFQNFINQPLVVVAKLHLGNPVQTISRNVTGQFEDPEGRLFDVQARDLGDGNFELTLDNPEIDGIYNVRLLAEFDDPSGVPQTLSRLFSVPVQRQLSSEVCDNQSSISSTPSSVIADGRAQIVVTATLVTCNGEVPDLGQGSVQFSTTLGTFIGEVINLGDGKFERRLTAPTVSGIAEIAVSLNSRRLQNTTSVEFTTGAVDPATSSFTFTNSEGFFKDEPGSIGTVLIVPRDSFGNRLGPNETVELFMGINSTNMGTITGPMISPQGDYTFTIVLTGDPQPGSQFFSSQVNSVELETELEIDVVQATLAIDSDQDGLIDSLEAILGTNPNSVDTDEDGLSDFDEVNRDGDISSFTPGQDTDPTNPDTDGDGVLDGNDVNPLVAAAIGEDDEIPFLPPIAYLVLMLLLAKFGLNKFKARKK